MSQDPSEHAEPARDAALLPNPMQEASSPGDASEEAKLVELQALFSEITGSWSELVRSVKDLKTAVEPEEPLAPGAVATSPEASEESLTVLASVPRESAATTPEPCPPEGASRQDESKTTDVTERLNGLLEKVRARLDAAQKSRPEPTEPGD